VGDQRILVDTVYTLYLHSCCLKLIALILIKLGCIIVSRHAQSSYYANEPGWSFAAFAMIGIVMTPLGDGLVIPGLSAFKPLNLGPMPQTMFTAAPLEVVVCLFAFGIVQVRALVTTEVGRINMRMS
jgi:hypothetical protein